MLLVYQLVCTFYTFLVPLELCNQHEQTRIIIMSPCCENMMDEGSVFAQQLIHTCKIWFRH